MYVDPSCSEMCLEEITTLARDFYPFFFFVNPIMKEICNFAFCFLPVTGEKGVCAISMWNLNIHFPLTFIIQSFKAKAL